MCLWGKREGRLLLGQKIRRKIYFNRNFFKNNFQKNPEEKKYVLCVFFVKTYGIRRIFTWSSEIIIGR